LRVLVLLKIYNYLKWRWQGSYAFLKEDSVVYFVYLQPSQLEGFLEKAIVSAIGSFCFYAEQGSFLVFGKHQDVDNTNGLEHIVEKCSKEMRNKNVFFANKINHTLLARVAKRVVCFDSEAGVHRYSNAVRTSVVGCTSELGELNKLFNKTTKEYK
jgi:capsule polysaccharide modification protein KpsS